MHHRLQAAYNPLDTPRRHADKSHTKRIHIPPVQHLTPPSLFQPARPSPTAARLFRWQLGRAGRLHAGFIVAARTRPDTDLPGAGTRPAAAANADCRQFGIVAGILAGANRENGADSVLGVAILNCKQPAL